MTSIQEYECVFCKESFDNKEALQIHFRKHADPNFNSNKGRVQSASPSLDSSRDGAELVSCDVCPEMFPTISKAITHKHKVHPEHDAKYFCPWCGKLFTMKHLYNKHIQANHSNLDKTDEKSFHCDCCNVGFHTPAAVLYHNRFFHRQDTDIPLFGQSKKLKMYNQEVIPIYYCSFCGEEYENKVNLHKHAGDDHNDENQSPDVVMRCPLCDAIFYHLDAYELHLTFHSSEDLYSERSEMADDISEYSLESVPPIMEKVENCELQQDAETTMKEVGIEDFLEQALEEPESIITKKNKKHKKHKKSKKSAITLDEFLNMNKDVFGEGLDFQGVEEVPTQVITKKLKVAKKPPIISSAIAPELEKLRKHGIVIKKQPGHGIPIPNKVLIHKSLRPTQRNVMNKAHCEPKVTTSVDTLDKLINNANNQIKIVKKSNKDNFPKSENTLNIQDMENYEMECDSTKKDIGDLPAKDSSSHDESLPIENSPNLHELMESKVQDNDFQTKSDIHENNDDINTKSEEIKDELNRDLDSLKSPLKSKSTNVESSINKDNNDENINDDDNICKTFDQNSADSNTSETTNKVNSLTSLKHLSHLITVKPVLTNKTATTQDSSINKNETLISDVGLLPLTKDIVSASDFQKLESVNDLLPSTEKKLPEKCLSPQTKSDSIKFRETANQDDENEIKKSPNLKGIMPKTNSMKNVQSKNSDLIQSQHISTNTGKISSSISDVKYNNKQETTNLLKHLTGITAKPINVSKTINKTNISTPTKNTNLKNVRKIIPQREQINDDAIEIFSIDDSDDEIDSGSQNNNANINNSTQPTNVLKNLGKNITVRSVNNTPENNITPEKNKITVIEGQHDVKCNDKNNLAIHEVQKCVKYEPNVSETSNKKGIPKVIPEKDSALKIALKNLSKNITVKSRNSSPSHTAKSKDQNENNQDFNDVPLTRVQITELHDNEDDDALETDFENRNNIVVESPEDSHSDKDVNEEMDMEDDDYENQIKVNMLKKDESIKSPESDASVSGISGISKDKMNHLPDDSDEDNDSFEDNPALEITKNLGKQISIRSLKNIRKDINQENNPNTEEPLRQSTSNTVTNQRMSTSNQVNTVNKEVTVKTFQTQTKTVVQEITTTVTKTIKTVKQEVRNVSNYGSTSRLPQKVQGMKVQQSKNLQGIVVRHSSPLVRPKIRNTPPVKSAVGTTVRQSNPVIPLGTSVRPSNQIVPIRPRSNVLNIGNPRMPCVPKIRPSTSNQTASKITRPLKVSPEALILPTKRPNIEETSGPFSCFKKPKESLIPVSDVTTLNSSDSESISEYTSLSKSSSMNMVSTSRGKSVTTSTQMKSETSASLHQSSGMNSVSGIKMTKTSQSKQVQVHENNEVNPVHRTTLEAIQKLQKQGLLVKKPRLDIKDNSEDSNNSDDNNSTDNE